MKNELKRLKERSKKTVLRLLHRGEIEFKEGKFVLKETGLPIENLKYKTKFADDDDDFSDDDLESDAFSDKSGSFHNH